MIKVIVYQHRLLHYRLVLFNVLRETLARHGIELQLVHGQPSKAEETRKDVGTLPWATQVRNRFLSFRGRDLLWQELDSRVDDGTLHIIMQENRILSNYPIMLSGLLGKKLVAYWGHGKNFQSDAPTGWREQWKKWTLKKVNWWFAYTDITVDYIRAAGFDPQKITNLENAIDVTGFQSDLQAITPEQLSQLRQELGMTEASRVALFCGSLYPEKKVGLLLQGADRIRKEVGDFHFVVIGDGPSADEVKSFAASRPWVHVVGVKRGLDKARYFRLAHLQLNPGLVGLHVLDAFSAGLPMITTSTALHSPEIAYLRHGVNGIVVDGDDPDDYAGQVVSLLVDGDKRTAMAERCLQDAQRYTVENMARNFADGVIACLRSYGRYPLETPASGRVNPAEGL